MITAILGVIAQRYTHYTAILSVAASGQSLNPLLLMLSIPDKNNNSEHNFM